MKKVLISFGCILIAVAFLVKGVVVLNPATPVIIKASSFLIFANICFVLALLVKK